MCPSLTTHYDVMVRFPTTLKIHFVQFMCEFDMARRLYVQFGYIFLIISLYNITKCSSDLPRKGGGVTANALKKFTNPVLLITFWDPLVRKQKRG
jgi:hypothetical protein